MDNNVSAFNDPLLNADIHYAYNSPPDILSGTCGAEGNEENVRWSVDDGTLTISGSGAMADYTNIHTPPWHTYRESITSGVVESGVTAIGDYAFY